LRLTRYLVDPTSMQAVNSILAMRARERFVRRQLRVGPWMVRLIISWVTAIVISAWRGLASHCRARAATRAWLSPPGTT